MNTHFHKVPVTFNEYCGKQMKVNDGNMYMSKPNKNNICSWKKIVI